MHARVIRCAALVAVASSVAIAYPACSGGGSPSNAAGLPGGCDTLTPCPPGNTFDPSLCRCTHDTSPTRADDAATADSTHESCSSASPDAPGGQCVDDGEVLTESSTTTDGPACPSAMPCGPWAHFDPASCNCIFDTDAGDEDAAPRCPDDMPCPGGAHWVQQECRCHFDTEAGDTPPACPASMPCPPGTGWDQQACRCNADTD
jgi:hypothetical protein